jgi:RND family efflux transporter MFP subunit
MEHIDMSEDHKKTLFFKKAAKALVPLMLVAAGGAAWAYFKATAPTIQRTSLKRQAAVVQVQPVSQSNARTTITAMGTVVPSRKVTLKARVSGEIESVVSQFVPGGHIAKGVKLLSIDPSDHQVEVDKAQSALEDARAALSIEQGSQTIAREELRLLSELSAEDVAQTDLTLRKPQLQQAQAAVASAEADLRKARLDIERTVVRAPFNAMIIERDVNLGAYVGVQDSLATIVGTDEYWVEAVVALDQLSLIDFDYAGGCPAVVRSQAGIGQWEGRVVRIAGKLNETSRMATVIVAVSDPLRLHSYRSAPPLIIDDYVFVEIAGRQLSGVIELSRSALQDEDTVWVCDNNTLDIRSVTLAWKSADKVYIQKGLAAGEQVIISELASPVQGMSLKIVGAESDGDAMAGAERKAS